MSAVDDLRILWDMADEINRYGWTQLPSSLRGHIKTKRGQHVALVLEQTAQRLMASGHREAALQRQVDGLRNEMQRFTDQMLEMEKNVRARPDASNHFRADSQESVVLAHE
jgi:hypothetical protein